MAFEGLGKYNNIRSSYLLNIAPAKNESTLDIFGVVGLWWDGVESKAFVDEIRKLDVDKLTINSSSPGGFVDDGLMIYDAIRSHRAFVTARLSGLVASAATWIACAADEVVGSDTLLYMIHNVQGVAVGDKDEMRKQADLSEKMENVIINLYRKKTGKRKSQIQRWLDAETWFTLDEAIENGFVGKKGDGVNFEYESSASNEDVREIMTNTLKCANLPELKAPEAPEQESNKSDMDNNIELNREQKGLFAKLVNSFKSKPETNEAEAQDAFTNELVESLKERVSELENKLAEAQKSTEGAVNLEELQNTLQNSFQEAAQNAANAVKDELTKKLDTIEQKLAEVENKTDTSELENKLDEKVENVAKAVNVIKANTAKPEKKDNNGDGLEKTVAEPNNMTLLVREMMNQN